MSINLANALKLSYNAGTQQLFSIAPIDNSLLTQRRVLFLASSTTIIPAKFMGQWDNAATYVATIYNPRPQFVVGGPAMVHINEDKICQVAVINTAPHEVCLEKRDFLGAVKALEQHLTALHPVETIPVGSLFLSATAPLNVATDSFLQQTLNHTPAERRSAVEDLLWRHAGLLEPNLSTQL